MSLLAQLALSRERLRLGRLDAWLTEERPRLQLDAGWRRFAAELLFFGMKQARACLFAGSFFAAIFLLPQQGLLGLPRYDALLAIALLIQAAMLWTKLESWDELRAICLFHVLGFALEAFKTSDAVRSWSYPDFAYTKLMGVPLFSGFMYAAVGSYVIQAWRLLDLRVRHHPPRRGSSRCSSTRTSSATTSSATIAGTSPRERSASMPEPS